jgi:hypothetical protein
MEDWSWLRCLIYFEGLWALLEVSMSVLHIYFVVACSCFTLTCSLEGSSSRAQALFSRS